MFVVHPSVKAGTLGEFVALARAQPGKLNFGSSGQAGTPHLCGELLRNLTGIDIVHVPYRGGAPAQVDLLAGRVQAYCAGFPGLHPHIKSGRLRALAVTAPLRAPVMPEVPTAAEAGVRSFEVSAWNGILAPAKTPQAVSARLHAAIAALARKPDYEAELRARGVEPLTLGPAAFRDYIKRESDRWAKVVKAARITAE